MSVNCKLSFNFSATLKSIQDGYFFVLGTDEELKKHNELMGKFPEMEHADTNMIRVDPGKTGEVLWRFSKTGEVGFACLLAGHFDAGMKGVIKVFTESMPGHGSKNDSRVNTDH